MAEDIPPSTIELKDIVFHEQIATGSFSTVDRVTWDNGTKQIQAAATYFDDTRFYKQEVYFLSIFKHSNIIEYFGHLTTDVRSILLTEYCSKGSLENHLKRESSLPESNKWKWMLELAHAINYLHQQNIVHRDVNPRRCLITSDDTLKLCGFHFAQRLPALGRKFEWAGTMKYTAPEVFLKFDLSLKADVYSYGIVVWQLETCQAIPFKGQVLYNMAGELYDLHSELSAADLADERKQLIQECLERNPEDRPTMRGVVNHLGKDRTPAEIRARGPASLAAYKQALQSGKKPVYKTRLLFVGQERVGKTSLKNRLIGKRFDPQESITDGIDASDSCHVSVEHARDWNVDLPPGDVHLQALAECMAKDLTRVDTAVNVKIQPDNLTEQETTTQPNLPNQKMSKVTHGAAKVTNPSVGDTTTKAKTASEEAMPPAVHAALVEELQKGPKADVQREVELSLWDFAGQKLYYVTHQVFLTKRSIVLLVFNLAEERTRKQKLQERVAEKLRHLSLTRQEKKEAKWLSELDFWMHSIYASTTEEQNQCQSTSSQDQLSPPIILVGTHRNKLDESQSKADKLIRQKFKAVEDSLEGKCYQKHVVKDTFVVENSEDDNNGIAELKAKIESVVKNQSYMGEEIPLRWLKFEESVKRAVKDGIHFLTIDQVRGMDGAREIPSSEPEELSTMLQFYHDLGIIMYHPNATSSLRKLIILDTQWLIGVFKSVITVIDKVERRSVDLDAWKKLDNEGVLEDSLISYMWRGFLGKEDGKGDGKENQTKEALLDLMKKYDLLVEQRCLQQDTDASPPRTCYYVPSRLHMESDAKPKERPGCTVFYVDFYSFLPVGIFYRLMARAVEWSQQQGHSERPPVLSRSESSFVADDNHQFELLRTGNMIMVTIVPREITGGKSKAKHITPQTCLKVKLFLQSALEDLKSTWMPRLKHQFMYKCPCATDEKHYVNLDNCLDDKFATIQCGKRKSVHTKVIREKFCSNDITKEKSEADRSATTKEPFDPTVILSIEYDIAAGGLISTPLELINLSQRNSTSDEKTINWSTSRTRSTSKTYEWHWDNTTAISADTEFSTGTPIIAEGKIQAGVTNTFAIGQNRGKQNNQSDEWTFELPAIVKPQTSLRVQVGIQQGKIDVPFKAVLKKGDRRWTERGTYKGTECYNLQVDYTELPLKE